MTLSTLTTGDLAFVVRRVPKDVRELLENNSGLLFLGGGFIRDTIAGIDPKDVDLLGASKLFLQNVARKFTEARGGKFHETDNAITVIAPPRMPVQFITRWTFDEPHRLVESFDFTVCQSALWFDKRSASWLSMCSERFYSDLAARRLVYTFPLREEEAGGSMMRVRKFLQRGYTIQPDSLGGVMARVAQKVNWGQIDALGLTAAEREREAAKVVAGLLYEVDPLLVVDGLDPIEERGEGA